MASRPHWAGPQDGAAAIRQTGRDHARVVEGERRLRRERIVQRVQTELGRLSHVTTPVGFGVVLRMRVLERDAFARFRLDLRRECGRMCVPPRQRPGFRLCRSRNRHKCSGGHPRWKLGSWVHLPSGSDGRQESPAISFKLLAGAHAVQVVSVLLRHGPHVLVTLREGIEQWMASHDYASIGAFRGRLNHARTPDSSAFERANYIRVLRCRAS